MTTTRTSWLISSVGWLNVLIGIVFVGFGVYVLIAGADAVAALFHLQNDAAKAATLVGGKDAAVQAKEAAGFFSKGLSGILLAMVSVIAGCSIAQGLPNLLVGVGVILRSNLARVFAIVFAVLALLEGFACLSSTGQSSRFLYAGLFLLFYAILTFVALLGRRATVEFSSRLQRNPGVNINVKDLLLGQFSIPPLNYTRKDNTGQNAYMKAVLKGHFEATQKVWPNRTGSGASDKDWWTDSKGNSLLHLLIADGDWTKVRLIMPPQGATGWTYGNWYWCCFPKQTNAAGQEPWMLAAEKAPLDIVKHLLPTPTLADLQRKDFAGKTGLDIATANGNAPVAAYLTQLQAELTKKLADEKAKQK